MNDNSSSKQQQERDAEQQPEQEFHPYKLLGALGIVIGLLALISYLLNVYFLGTG